MMVLCIDNDRIGNIYLTLYKKYDIIETRKWSNGYTQYLIKNDIDHENWYSKSRFSNRIDKLKKLNKISNEDS